MDKELELKQIKEEKAQLMAEVEPKIERIEELSKREKDLEQVKFILILPPHIDKYLKFYEARGHAKAEITRDAIIKMMESDYRYQEHIKQNG